MKDQNGDVFFCGDEGIGVPSSEEKGLTVRGGKLVMRACIVLPQDRCFLRGDPFILYFPLRWKIGQDQSENNQRQNRKK
jgi:hypothetical protein